MVELDLRGINLRNDIIFKYVFASENSESILISLLNAIFSDSGQELVTEVTYLNPFNIRESMNDKTTVLDIRVSDMNGKQFNIEMQVRNELQFIERVIYYNSKLLSGQLEEAQSYKKLNKTISIAITDFKLFKSEKAIHNIYRLLNVKSYKELANLTEYHFIELPKYKDDKSYDDPINRWIYMLVNGENFINNPELLPDSIKKEAMIMKAMQKMKKAAADPELRAIIEYREKAIRDEADKLFYAEKKGEKRGMMLGKHEGVLEEKFNVARQLIRLKVSLETISSATGLTIEEVKKLID